MPWQEVVTVDLRQQFVQDALRQRVPVTELCAAYGISRKTGYKFLARYRRPRGRGPGRSVPAASPLARRARRRSCSQRLLEAHQRHPYWGPRKLLRLVQRQLAGRALAGALHRRAPLHSTSGSSPPAAACADPGPPGRHRRADGRPQCGVDDRLQRAVQARRRAPTAYPLTVADGYSRMLLACQALTSTRLVEARPVFERLFREYGLPVRIRSDNGVPFATPGARAASPLSRSGGFGSGFCPT